jgi:hypothetical protein
LAVIAIVPTPATDPTYSKYTFAVVSWLASNWLLVMLKYKTILQTLKISEAINRISTDPKYVRHTLSAAENVNKIREMIEREGTNPNLLELFE